MKKIIGSLLVLSLLLFFAPAALAAGSASLSGSSTARAGDTVTVTFSAGGGILGGQGTVSYDASQLTLQGYTASIGGSWKVEFGGNNFAFYDDAQTSPISGSKAIFKATFRVNDSVAPGTTVTVSVNGIRLSDGQSESSLGTKSHSFTILEPLSDNCNLAGLTVSNATISPAFSTATTSYSASVPYTVSSLQISATAEHSGAKVSVSNNQLTPGGTTTVKVTVTAENGATKVYAIRVARAQDPNYVPSSNALLHALTTDNGVLSPAFSQDVTQYYIWLPYETEGLSVTAEAADGKAQVTVDQAQTLTPGKANPVTVTVTAEDGTQQVYTVQVVRAPAHSDVEAFLNPVPTEPEPTEPETEPVTEPTVPMVDAPKTNREAGFDWSLLIAGLAGILAGAGIVALIRRKK